MITNRKKIKVFPQTELELLEVEVRYLIRKLQPICEEIDPGCLNLGSLSNHSKEALNQLILLELDIKEKLKAIRILHVSVEKQTKSIIN